MIQIWQNWMKRVVILITNCLVMWPWIQLYLEMRANSVSLSEWNSYLQRHIWCIQTWQQMQNNRVPLLENRSLLHRQINYGSLLKEIPNSFLASFSHSLFQNWWKLIMLRNRLLLFHHQSGRNYETESSRINFLPTSSCFNWQMLANSYKTFIKFSLSNYKPSN